MRQEIDVWVWEQARLLLCSENTRHSTSPLTPEGSCDTHVVRFLAADNRIYQVSICDKIAPDSYSQTLALCDQDRVVFQQEMIYGERANQEFDKLHYFYSRIPGFFEAIADSLFDEDTGGLYMVLTGELVYPLNSEKVLELFSSVKNIT